MVRKSSDEVKVEILDSEAGDNYWNLRDIRESNREEYNMNRKYDRNRDRSWNRKHNSCIQGCSQENSSRCSQKDICGCERPKYCGKEKTNSLRIQFDLDEEREVTEDQKQVILNTLTGSDNVEKNRDYNKRSNFDIPVSANLITLFALLAFLAVLALSLGSGYNGFY